MSFTNIMTAIFGLFFIIILYVIIYYALKIMYKDVRTGGRRRKPTSHTKSYGLEILNSGGDPELTAGSIIPIRSDLTIGRNSDNSVCISNQYVSGNHAVITVRNHRLFIEDLHSTNGTIVNGKSVSGRKQLDNKDEIKIGKVVFKIVL